MLSNELYRWPNFTRRLIVDCPLLGVVDWLLSSLCDAATACFAESTGTVAKAPGGGGS